MLKHPAALIDDSIEWCLSYIASVKRPWIAITREMAFALSGKAVNRMELQRFQEPLRSLAYVKLYIYKLKSTPESKF